MKAKRQGTKGNENLYHFTSVIVFLYKKGGNLLNSRGFYAHTKKKETISGHILVKISNTTKTETLSRTKYKNN